MSLTRFYRILWMLLAVPLLYMAVRALQELEAISKKLDKR